MALPAARRDFIQTQKGQFIDPRAARRADESLERRERARMATAEAKVAGSVSPGAPQAINSRAMGKTPDAEWEGNFVPHLWKVDPYAPTEITGTPQTRVNSQGQTETLMPSQSGGRWVGSTATPAPVGNQNPTVITSERPKEIWQQPAPHLADGSVDPRFMEARSSAMNAALAANGGHLPATDETTTIPAGTQPAINTRAFRTDSVVTTPEQGAQIAAQYAPKMDPQAQQTARASLYNSHPEIFQSGTPQNIAFVEHAKQFGEQSAHANLDKILGGI